MVEIFKGKDNDGVWREGFYCVFNDEAHRIYTGYAETDCGEYYPDYYTVIPQTVRRCAGGITDKNGKKVFEGDIVTYEDAVADFEGYHDDVFLNCGEVGISAWDGIYFTNRQTVDMSDLYESETMVDCEIIGNIHDNPELLGGEGNG